MRGLPVPNQPKTIGEHLKMRRFELGISQAEAARRVSVTLRTVAAWERDKARPSGKYHPRLVEYLGCDPFHNLALGSPKGNEPSSVAILGPTAPLALGQQIRKRREELKKTQKECAKELGVSVKTLWGWETSQRQPWAKHLNRVLAFLGTGLEMVPAK